MYGLAEYHAAALPGAQFFRTAWPVQVIGVVEGLNHAHPAKNAAFDPGPSLGNRQIETVAGPHHQCDAGALAGRDHRGTVIHRDRQRLLDQHVFAGRRRGLGLRRMQFVGCGDVDGFQARVCQQTVQVGIGVATESLLEREAGFRARRTGCHGCHPFVGEQGRRGERERPAEPDDPEAHRIRDQG